MASIPKPNSEYTLRKSQYLTKCEPVKDKALCQTLVVAKVQAYAKDCDVPINDDTGHRKPKETICSDLATRYTQEVAKEIVIDKELRKDLNRVYFNLYFRDAKTKANMIQKLFFAEEIKALDQKKRDFIDIMTSMYTDIDNAIEAENIYKIVDALYYYGLAIEKMYLLTIMNDEIKVEKKYKNARHDLTNQLGSMIRDYTLKLTRLTSLLKEGGKADNYLTFLASRDFDIHDLHEFTIYGEDRYAKIVDVHDGDTTKCVIQVDNNFFKWGIRYYGFDAYEITTKNPEKKARAVMAKQVLQELILGKVVIVQPMPTADKYGRLLALVFMFKKDLPPNFDFHPRYTDIVSGLPENDMSSSSSSNKIERIPVSSFHDLLKEYFRPNRPDLIFVNQLMLDLGLGIPYVGGHKVL